MRSWYGHWHPGVKCLRKKKKRSDRPWYGHWGLLNSYGHWWVKFATFSENYSLVYGIIFLTFKLSQLYRNTVALDDKNKNDVSPCNKNKIEEKKRQRDHILQLNQILAHQVMEKSKLVAGKNLIKQMIFAAQRTFRKYITRSNLPL